MLSALQEFILKECYYQKAEKVGRSRFECFYGHNSKIKPTLIVKIITKSLERLIDRGMIIGYGVRTPKKWFIREVKITRNGRKTFEVWQRRKQRKLPFVN